MSKERRGPGRPPRVVIPNVPIIGVVDEPQNEDNIIELSYYDPIIFKHLFTLFKNLKVRDIYFKFCKESMSVYTMDNLDNKIIVHFNCDKLMNYYCGDAEINICVNRENIQAVFINLNKTINLISILLERGNDMIQIKLTDKGLNKIKTRNVIISEKQPDDSLRGVHSEIKNLDSPLTFSLTTRDFKDTISDATSYGDKITIEKHGESPLILRFIKAHTNVCSEEYNDESKIDLESNLDDDSFICILHTLILKSISVSIINNKIKIKCLPNNGALLSSSIGELIDFSVLVINQ